MKKQDLVEGTIYAYRKDTYSDSRPVRLVSTTLLKAKTEYPSKTVQLFKAPQGSVPGRDYGKNIGYAVISGASAEKLAAFDIEAHWKRCIEAKEMIQPEDDEIRFELLNNRYFNGLWETVDAGRKAKRARIDANNAKGRAWAKERSERFIAARDVISEALGVVPQRSFLPNYDPAYLKETSPVEDGRYTSQGEITLSVEQMEKLAALLSQR